VCVLLPRPFTKIGANRAAIPRAGESAAQYAARQQGLDRIAVSNRHATTRPQRIDPSLKPDKVSGPVELIDALVNFLNDVLGSGLPIVPSDPATNENSDAGGDSQSLDPCFAPPPEERFPKPADYPSCLSSGICV